MNDIKKVESGRPEVVLKDFFERNGCIRVRPDDPEKGRHGGVELRFVVSDMPERRAILAALKALDIGHGKVYRKQKSRHQWVIPVYGRSDVVTFLKQAKPRNAGALQRKVVASGRRKAPATGDGR